MSNNGGFFSMESPFYKFMARLFDMLKLNALWLLCSGVVWKFVLDIIIQLNGLDAFWLVTFVPMIIGFGPSTAAVFSVTLRMVDEQEGYIAEPFFRAFKENYKKAAVIGIILMIAVYAIWIDFQFYFAAEQLHRSSLGFLIVGIVATVLTFTHMLYAFPLQARYENTIINTLRNSHSIAVKYILKTIFLLVVLAVLIVIFMWNNTLVFLGILIGPACLMLVISSWAMQAFRLIEYENENRENTSK